MGKQFGRWLSVVSRAIAWQCDDIFIIWLRHSWLAGWCMTGGGGARLVSGAWLLSGWCNGGSLVALVATCLLSSGCLAMPVWG